MAAICLHQASYSLWIIDDEIIDVIVVHYIRDVLSLAGSRRASCVYLRVSLIDVGLRVTHSNVIVVSFKLDRIILYDEIVAPLDHRLPSFRK